MFGLGTSELLIVLALVLVLFGAGKIPQLGKGLGEGIRNFKRGLKGSGEDEASAADSERSRRLPNEAHEDSHRS